MRTETRASTHGKNPCANSLRQVGEIDQRLDVGMLLLESGLDLERLHLLQRPDVDLLVDALTKLFDAGFIVLFTPKAGRPGHVEASDVEEAASTAGLTTGGQVNVASEWAGARLMPPKGPRR